jgi:hypothetical protein
MVVGGAETTMPITNAKSTNIVCMMDFRQLRILRDASLFVQLVSQINLVWCIYLRYSVLLCYEILRIASWLSNLMALFTWTTVT